VLFALVLNRIPDTYQLYPASVLQDAVRDAFELVLTATQNAPSSLNIAFTDGETLIATRFRNGKGETPPSLYYNFGPFTGEEAWSPSVGAQRGQACLVASEPLSVTGTKECPECPGGWKVVPANVMVTVSVSQEKLRKDLLKCSAEHPSDAIVLDSAFNSLSDLAGGVESSRPISVLRDTLNCIALLAFRQKDEENNRSFRRVATHLMTLCKPNLLLSLPESLYRS